MVENYVITALKYWEEYCNHHGEVCSIKTIGQIFAD